ncbi:hypothetical protein [Rhodovulum sp.]|uniref:hypothetical protein n=1 Tax=Rhodovulum sp. TaxID=34009 RepID=UPI0018473642|nr:hypothetical protein [Rhodovulum sp.]HDR28435.1 hypothetical protein [Rhodovulum sp.]
MTLTLSTAAAGFRAILWPEVSGDENAFAQMAAAAVGLALLGLVRARRDAAMQTWPCGLH